MCEHSPPGERPITCVNTQSHENVQLYMWTLTARRTSNYMCEHSPPGERSIICVNTQSQYNLKYVQQLNHESLHYSPIAEAEFLPVIWKIKNVCIFCLLSNESDRQYSTKVMKGNIAEMFQCSKMVTFPSNLLQLFTTCWNNIRWYCVGQSQAWHIGIIWSS
jgi:hypothetical protein